MEIVIHRVNKVKNLSRIPNNYGCEIDIRSFGSNLILNHDPYKSGDLLSDFLDSYNHGLLVLNIKETGIENDVISLVKKRKIKRYFLLDVEFPYIYKNTILGEKSIAIRYSELEPIQMALNYENKVDWVWIDTNTILPINNEIVSKLKNFKTCLVSPECWNRPDDIISYRKKMLELDFTPNAVMTDLNYAESWEKIILK